MKKLTMILGILVLVAGIAGPGMAQDTNFGEGLLAEDKTIGQEALPKSDILSEEVYQDVFSEIAEEASQALDKRIVNAMDKLFVESFVNKMAQANHVRECDNTETAGIKLLQARLSFELIQHAMEKTDADKVVKELEKTPQEIDVELILNAVSKVYPNIRDSYNIALYDWAC